MLKEMIREMFGFDKDKMSFAFFYDDIRYELMFRHAMYDGNIASFCYTGKDPLPDDFLNFIGSKKKALVVEFLMALEKATGKQISSDSVSCANDISIAFSSRMTDVTFVICV